MYKSLSKYLCVLGKAFKWNGVKHITLCGCTMWPLFQCSYTKVNDAVHGAVVTNEACKHSIKAKVRKRVM